MAILTGNGYIEGQATTLCPMIHARETTGSNEEPPPADATSCPVCSIPYPIYVRPVLRGKHYCSELYIRDRAMWELTLTYHGQCYGSKQRYEPPCSQF